MIPWSDSSAITPDTKARLEAMIAADDGLLGERLSAAFPADWAEDEYEFDLVVGGRHYVFKFRPLPTP